jgi:hypothetical protein
LDDANANLARADIRTHLDVKPPNLEAELDHLSLDSPPPASSSRLLSNTYASPRSSAQSVDSSQDQTLSNRQPPHQLQGPVNQTNTIYDCSKCIRKLLVPRSSALNISCYLQQVDIFRSR